MKSPCIYICMYILYVCIILDTYIMRCICKLYCFCDTISCNTSCEARGPQAANSSKVQLLKTAACSCQDGQIVFGNPVTVHPPSTNLLATHDEARWLSQAKLAFAAPLSRHFLLFHHCSKDREMALGQS